MLQVDERTASYKRSSNDSTRSHISREGHKRSRSRSRSRTRSRSRSHSRSRESKRARYEYHHRHYHHNHSRYHNESSHSDHQRRADSSQAERRGENIKETETKIALTINKEDEDENEYKKKVEQQLKIIDESEEERRIRERREKRLQILAKYSKNQESSGNLNAENNNATNSSPSSSTSATPITTVNAPNNNMNNNNNNLSDTTLVNVAVPYSQNQLTAKGFEEVTDQLAEEVISGGDIRKKTGATNAPKIDMFGDEDEEEEDGVDIELLIHDKYKQEKIDARALIIKEADPSDDAEGYYRYRINETLHNRYQIVGHHGKGVFSNVLKAIDLLGDNEGTGSTDSGTSTDSKKSATEGATSGTPKPNVKYVAIKCLRNNDHMRRTGLKEIRILEQLKASDPEGRYNCIKLLGHFEDRHHLCLVFEPMDLNLRQVLKKYGNNTGLSIRAVRIYAYKLLRALLLLKRNNLIHADFKPDNILVNADRTVVKLADFGSAFENSNSLELTPYLVSRFYRAPEIILGLQYSFPIDMFSFGTCLYEFACGRPMFLSRNNNHHLKLIMDVKGNFPKKMLQKAKYREIHFTEEFRFKERVVDPVTKKEIEKVSPTVGWRPTRNVLNELLASYGGYINDNEKQMVIHLADLIDKCTTLDPSKRITPEEALKHPLFLSHKR